MLFSHNRVLHFIGFRFASYYQDHMVLQRHPNRAVIWGYGNVSSAVTIKFEDTVYEAGVIAGS